MSKIVKVESRSKACFDYAETHPIFDAKQSKIVKVESRFKLLLHGARLSLSLAFAEDRMRLGHAKLSKLLLHGARLSLSLRLCKAGAGKEVCRFGTLDIGDQ